MPNLQSLTHETVAHGPIWLCAFGLTVLHGCTPLSCGITAHHPGYIHGCWFDQALFCCIKRFCSCIFPSNRKRSTHCFTMGEGFHSLNRWTIVNDRGTKFSRGWGPGWDRGLNFAGAGTVKHISWFSYLKKTRVL